MEQGQATKDFKPGDYVAWKYGTGKVTGHVIEKLTEDRKLGTRTFKATMEEPKYLLKIEKSGKEVIRKAESLEMVDSEETRQDIGEENGAGTQENDVESDTEDQGAQQHCERREAQGVADAKDEHAATIVA